MIHYIGILLYVFFMRGQFTGCALQIFRHFLHQRCHIEDYQNGKILNEGIEVDHLYICLCAVFMKVQSTKALIFTHIEGIDPLIHGWIVSMNNKY